MKRLERRCRLLLRAYPAWYRRERGEEIVGTLLDASPPGGRRPSFRDARALVMGGLRVRGPAWCLSMLWAGLGALGAGYDFIVSAHVPEAAIGRGVPIWVGEPGVVQLAAALGGLAWVLATIPVLVAGLVRVRSRGLLAVAWVGVWLAGLALLVKVVNWQPSAPAVMACGKEGCSLAGYRYAVVSWGELAVLAQWLALAAAMTVILARPARGQDPLPESCT